LATGLNGRLRASKTIAEAYRQRIEVGDSHDQPPKPSRARLKAPGLDELEDRRSQAPESLANVWRGLTDAAQRHPDRSQFTRGAVEVRSENDEMIEGDSAIRMRRAGRGSRYESIPDLGLQAVDRGHRPDSAQSPTHDPVTRGFEL
jgi:hypothetical protein